MRKSTGSRRADWRWLGLRSAWRSFRATWLIALACALVAVGAAGAILQCQALWLSVAAYVLLAAGAILPARPLLRLGLEANTEGSKTAERLIPDGTSKAKLSVFAIWQHKQGRHDAFAALLGLVLAFVGLTLSVLVLPVLDALGVFACAGRV